MKISSSYRSSAAFTLIELLVVISIIAVLATMAIPATTKVMDTARKTQARNDMGNIASAVKLYYSEYGRYPIPAVDQTAGDTSCVYGATTAKGSDEIFNVLRYIATADNVTTLNPRQIKFMEPRVSTAKKACLNSSTGKWYDPWGTEYIIFIDGDYNSDIDPSPAFSGGITLDTNNRVPISVGVASVGLSYVKSKTTPQPETLRSSKTFDKTTDLLSWQ